MTAPAQQIDPTEKFLDGLDSVISTGHVKPHDNRDKFPCESCGGSGNYRGARIHQPKSHCFACGGRGYFLTSPHDRQKATQQRKARESRKRLDAQAAFDAAYPGLIKALIPCGAWSEFALSLVTQYASHGSLSDKQAQAAQALLAKVAARQQARDEEKVANTATVDLTPIRTMFETAHASGHKRPKYRAEGLIINRAPDHGKNPGALYVKSDQGDIYLGKIIGTEYQPSREAGKDVAETLHLIAEDPRGAAVRYGRKTGSCACCGRELTNAESVELGIGPICAGKWGL